MKAFLVVPVAVVLLYVCGNYGVKGQVNNCPDSEKKFCIIPPCFLSACPTVSAAECLNEYCGDCIARWFSNGQEVTSVCLSSQQD